MTKRVQKAIDILLDALNEGTLMKGHCCVCAVGNLVRAGMLENGGKRAPKNSSLLPRVSGFAVTAGGVFSGDWGMLFRSAHGRQHTVKNLIPWKEEHALKAITYTDFTKEELMQIEFAFETNTSINTLYGYRGSKAELRKDQIRGLEAVVKVMLSFEESTEDAKEVFTKRAEAIPV